MRFRALLQVCLGFAIACTALPAQTTDREDDRTPTAQVTVVPSLRGDLSVTLSTWGMPENILTALRRGFLPCDWRLRRDEADRLEGVCRKYLRSDGTSANGLISLAPLAIALRGAGAGNIRLELDYTGTPAAVPKGWRPVDHRSSRAVQHQKSATYEFWSLSYAQTPEPLEIHIGTPWSWSRLFIPLGFTLFAPAILALWLRRRAERKGAVEAASVWTHWILTGMWLYWISAVSLTDIAAFGLRLHIDSMVLTFLIGTVVFAGVPLAGVASCIALLMRDPDDQPGESTDTGGLVMRSVAREATLMIPFGMFLVGTGMFDQDWHVGIVSLPLAFLTYRVLAWWSARKLFGGVELLSRGSLMETTSVIARRAGVELSGLYIIGNRSPREANAFASGGKMMALTRGLVERLTCRELLAVIGHEMGHLRKRHVGARIFAFWGYIIVVGPLAGSLMERAHLPHWILSLPLLPLGYIFGTAWLSRKNEFTADAQAVELVGDAEGMIAALARLRKLSRLPVDWGGIQGSILSHPSMRERVLAIARRFNVAEDRALALMEDPDLLCAGTPLDQLHYSLPAECAGRDFVFTSSWRHAYTLWSTWIGYVFLVAIVIGAGTIAIQSALALRVPHVLPMLAFGIPVCARIYLAVLGVLDRVNMKFLRRKLRRRLGPLPEGAIFAGLLPGDRVGHVDGFALWDAGFLTLGPDCLTYRGERTEFSLPRSEVTAVSIEKGPVAWDRDYGVRLACAGGSFSFTRPDRGTSRWEARRLRKVLDTWRQVGGGASVVLAPPIDPVVFVSRVNSLRGWAAVRFFSLRAFFLLVGLVILMPFAWVMTVPAVAFVPFACPLCYLVAHMPYVLRRKAASSPAPVVESAPVAIPGTGTVLMPENPLEDTPRTEVASAGSWNRPETLGNNSVR